MIANIALTDARHAVDKLFDYLIPPELERVAKPGMRVLVPFGVRNTAVEGLILSVSQTSEFPSLKPLIRCLDPLPVLTEELISLCVWMRHQYLCSFQQSYRQVKPPYLGTRLRQWLFFLKDTEEKLSAPQRRLLDTLKEYDGFAEMAELEAALHRTSIRSSAYALQDKGLLEIREKIDNTISLKYIRKARLNFSPEEGYATADELRSRRATVQADMVLTLCDCGDLPTSDLVLISDGNYNALNALKDKGIISIYREPFLRTAYAPDQYTPSVPYIPTEEQKPVIDYLNRLITHNLHEKILLRGVTGSGKTEVFLQAIETCIKQGKQAIMLVPEISLTPQMVERFVSRFGTSVAVMHSGLSQGERFDQWYKIRHGEVDVVVGARSAIFAPFKRLGIIILDEEHEDSYKSETAPRYHARDIAFRRGAKHGAPVLLASATPSVTSYYRAKTQKYRLFEMHQRYNQNPLPKARIVDMRSELLDYHNMSSISIRLQDEIRRNLDKKEKTILFLNRRGYNTFVSCRQCGYVMECPHCSIALTYHRSSDHLACHYCGYTCQNVTVCPECGSQYIKFFGTGTQKIEEELYTLFPGVRVLRMDFDTTSGKGGHEILLNRFKNGEADILLGTQMVTKGLDFADVTLVGVLAADTSLNINDYRANERCFSLITQVCGRAGRGNTEGRAVIQTYQPENVTIRLAKEQNYPDFYENEMKYREKMQYPPFCDMIHIVLSGEDERQVKQEIANIGLLLNSRPEIQGAILQTIGPDPAPIAKIKNKFRYRIFLKAADTQQLLPLLRQISTAHNAGNSKNTLTIDINPTNML
ncbi:primosomal protein N' [Oscillospiraceae bacterium DSM 107454]|uniref:Replication restart protein PriA n=2 Tax=Ructibacterium gallinarum TaxID=2779355 RepID=A0A9D5M0A7_9FIRM|nr:primosomal protein N' [Ructibacterium gallinarum]